MSAPDQDEKTIQLLNLLNEYQELTTIYRLHFINGFLNLSRANFHSEKTKFGKDTFDMRSYDACKVVDLCKNSDEFRFIDRRIDAAEDDNGDESTLQSAGQLKNRKKPNEKPTTTTTTSTTEKTNNATYKDPILQFGALTPPPLKSSQEDFDRALRTSVQLINIRRKIDKLTFELENE